MKFCYLPLHQLRDFLEEYIYNPSEDDTINYEYDCIQASFHLLHNAIADYMLSTKDDNILKRYMRTLQEQLRILFDQIPLTWIGDLDPHDPPDYDNPDAHHKNICYESFRLLKELQIHYPDYFNMNAIPPQVYTAVETSVYQPKVLLLNHWMETNGFQEQAIWHVVQEHIQKFCIPEERRYTYQEYNYTWNFVEQIKSQITTLGTDLNSNDLCNLLLYMNFNELNFRNVFISGILEEIDETLIPDEKIKILENAQNIVNSVLVRKDIALDPGLPPINLMIKIWLRAHLEELQT